MGEEDRDQHTIAASSSTTDTVVPPVPLPPTAAAAATTTTTTTPVSEQVSGDITPTGLDDTCKLDAPPITLIDDDLDTTATTQQHTATIDSTQPTAAGLSWRVKLAYAMGSSGMFAVFGLMGFFLQSYLLEVAQVDPVAVGVLLLVGQILDAGFDPLVGRISDQTDTRFGRRRPYIVGGMIPLIGTFFLLWIVPPVDDFWRLMYYSPIILIFHVAYAVVSVPYAALVRPPPSNSTDSWSIRFADSIC
jgi:hypothetical protein